MKRITIKQNQSLRDIALQHYGTLEALGELVTINEPVLRNDMRALVALGIDYLNAPGFYLDVALEPGLVIEVDEKSRLIDQNIVKELTREQTKYEHGTNY